MTMPIYSHHVPPVSDHPYRSSGARLVTEDGAELPLTGARLRTEAGGGIARSTLTQTFRNNGAEPLEVTYLLPLPADGAVSGYAFTLAGVTTRGVVEPKKKAREMYEEALVQGKSAALLDEEREALFRQAIGNIPPGESIEIEVLVDHPLTWTDGGWELRFPTVVAPRYGAPASIEVPVATGGVGAEAALQMEIRDALVGRPASPSHALTMTREGASTLVTFEDAKLDRDVVVRWGVATAQPGVHLETARPAADSLRARAAYGLITVVPPTQVSHAIPRDLIVLIDTSGSMGGEPLSQAVRMVSAMVESLGDHDRLEMIEFSWTPSRWKRAPKFATASNRKAALKWLKSLRASGGTEMKAGIDEALRTLREGAQRQVVLVSDGLIGFEREIVDTLANRLPSSCRFHCIGVGHGVNRGLTKPAARAGRGVEIIVAPGQDVEPARELLLKRTELPQVVNLKLGGSALLSGPDRPADLYAASPAMIPVSLKPQGGVLEIRGDSVRGQYVQRVQVPPTDVATGAGRVMALFAREQVADAEMRRATGAEVETEIEALGVDFQIATRLTSWVAVSDAQTVDPTKPTTTVEQPHELPAGMSAEGLGLRAASFGAAQGRMMAMPMAALAGPPHMRAGGGARPGGPPPGFAPPPPASSAAPPPANKKRKGGLLSRVLDAFGGRQESDADDEAPVPERTRRQRSAGPPPPQASAPAAPPLPSAPARPVPAKTDLDALSVETREAEEASDGELADAPAAGAAADFDEVTDSFSAEDGLGAEFVGGMVRMFNSQFLVVTLSGLFEWELPDVITVELEGGRTVTLQVWVERSTASQSCEPSQEIRVVLRVDSKFVDQPTRLFVGGTTEAYATLVVEL